MKHLVTHPPEALVFATLSALATSAHAQAVFSSDFNSYDVSGAHTSYLVLESDAQSQPDVYLRPSDFSGAVGTGSSLYSIVPVDGSTTDRALQVRRSGGDISTALYFPSQSLSVGDSIRFEAKMRYRFEDASITVPNIAQALRLGFANIDQEANFADTNPSSAVFVRTNPGRTSTSSTTVAYNLPTSSNLLGHANGLFTQTSGTPVASTDFNTETQWQSVSFTLTRNEASWSVVADGAFRFTGTTADVTGMPTSFNAFALRMNSHTEGTLLQFDDMSISVIPEPSSFAAFSGLAALGGAALRRRRRADSTRT